MDESKGGEEYDRLQISCHKHRFKHLKFQHIYRICYKIAKNGKPEKKDLPYLKTISQVLNPLLKLRIHSETVEKPVLKVRFCRTDHSMIF